MNKLFAAALGAVLLAVSPNAHAQAAGSITGFASIPWGSPESAITARLGRPVELQQEGPVKKMGYRDTVLGEEVAAWYLVHQTQGLIAGNYITAYSMGNSCWRVYSSIKNAIAERYPSIVPTVEEENRSQTLDMCESIAIGRGSAVTSWDDPVNEAQVYVQIETNPDYVQTWYFSGEGITILEEMNASRRREQF
jgi:hypothetical protein